MKIIVSDTNPIFKYIIETDDIRSIKLELEWAEGDNYDSYTVIQMKNGDEYTCPETLQEIATAMQAKIVSSWLCSRNFVLEREKKLDEESLSCRLFKNQSQNEEHQ